MKKLAISFLSITLILASCTKKTEFSHEIKNVKLTYEGATPGPNSIQGEMKLDLDSVFKANSADRQKIKNITVEEFNFSIEDGKTFDNFESFSVNFYSDKNNMTQVASLSPVPAGNKQIKVTVTDQVNLSNYFSEPSIFLIIDANLKASDSTAINLSADLKVKFSANETKK